MPGKWTSGRNSVLFIETPSGTWRATAHEDDSTWAVRGPNPDDAAHYADGEILEDEADSGRERFSLAKKRARAYVMTHGAQAPKKPAALLDREIAQILYNAPSLGTPTISTALTSAPRKPRRSNTNRRPYKPAVDTICDLNAFTPGALFTVAEFRKNALSPWYHNDPAEEAQFFKWAKRYGLVEDAPGRKYRLTAKGARVAREACHR
jgi:hypothetical protein